MYSVIFVTASSKKEARRIADGLVKNKLAACVNIIWPVESVFWWHSKIERGKELLLIIKSRKDKLAKIISLVKALHSYSVPEIIALPIIGGGRAYLKWIDESLRKSS